MSQCPSLIEILATTDDPAIAAHVNDCARCRALQRAATGKPDPGDYALPALPADVAPKRQPAERVEAQPGAFHLVESPGTDTDLIALVLETDDETATVLPVSADQHAGGDWDLLLSADQTRLGYACSVQLWNHVEVLLEQIGLRIGCTDEALLAAVDHAFDLMQADEEAPVDLKWGVALVAAADPRHRLREEDRVACARAGQPYAALASESLGAVLASARERVDERLEEVGEWLDLAVEKVELLETDDLDIGARVPVRALSKVIGQLNLMPSARLLRIVEETVFSTDFTPEDSTSVAFARRRKGVRSKRPRASEEVRRLRARRYRASLAKDLGVEP